MKKIILKLPKAKARMYLSSELVVTKIHKSPKDFRRKKLSIKNINLKDFDCLDDRLYE